MTSAEQTLLKNALDNIALHFKSNARILDYIYHWKADVDANVTSASSESQIVSGHSFKTVPVVVVSKLPAASTNDEAIVTDALNVTSGAVVVGGGANRVPVKFDGTNWRITPGTFTFDTLPATPSTNDEAVITDGAAITNGNNAAGGGSNRILVRWDGAHWVIV